MTLFLFCSIALYCALLVVLAEVLEGRQPPSTPTGYA